MLKCRVCFADCERKVLLNLYDKPVSIFDTNTNNSIALILSEVTQINVAAEENLPENVCFPCCYQLKDAQSFIKKAKQTDKLLRNNLKINENLTSDINIMSKHESPKSINTTIITDDSVDNLKEEIDDKTVNLQNINIDELDTPKIKINSPSLFTENSACVPEVSFRVSIIENASTISDQEAVSDEKDFFFKECEIKLEPLAFDEFLEECPDENIINSEVKLEFVPTADHIKVEPLSEDAALMYHQQSEVEENPSLLNGYHEESYFENEVKPTEDDLTKCANEYQLKNSAIKIAKIYSCLHCNKILGNEQSKLRHERKHRIKMFNERCLLCNKLFNSEMKLKHHVIKFHSYGEGFDFETGDSSNSNTEDRLKPKVRLLKCEHCPKVKFSSGKDYKKHMRTHRRRPENHLIMCIKCNRTFINKAAILSHFRHFHAQGTEIKVEKPDEDEIKEKVKKNGPKKVVQKKKKQDCDLNNKIKKNNDKNKILDKEGRKNRHLKPGFKYKRTIFRTVNIKIEKERKHVCTICKNRFIRKDHLTRHTRCVHGYVVTRNNVNLPPHGIPKDASSCVELI